MAGGLEHEAAQGAGPGRHRLRSELPGRLPGRLPGELPGELRTRQPGSEGGNARRVVGDGPAEGGGGRGGDGQDDDIETVLGDIDADGAGTGVDRPGGAWSGRDAGGGGAGHAGPPATRPVPDEAGSRNADGITRSPGLVDPDCPHANARRLPGVLVAVRGQAMTRPGDPNSLPGWMPMGLDDLPGRDGRSHLYTIQGAGGAVRSAT